MSMKSEHGAAIPTGVWGGAGVVWLRTAGVVDPTVEGVGGCVGTDLLLELGGVEGGEGLALTHPPRPRRLGHPPYRAGGDRPLACARGSVGVRVLAVGSGLEVGSHPAAAGAVEVDLQQSVVLPGMVNAHTHLDLTHLGPQPHDPATGFVAWVERIRAGRATDPAAIRASVERGIELSLRAGVVLVGDIAGAAKGLPRVEPFAVLAESGLSGVSFLEFFAMGTREGLGLSRLEAALAEAEAGGGFCRGGARLGVQPHAPNTVSLAGYRRAVELSQQHGLRLSTHLAETLEEREFIAQGTGPQREMLERFGFWDDAILECVGQGRSPVEHLGGVFGEVPFVLAHLNDTGPDLERTIEALANASVVYCPRASTYFDAPSRFGPHRYREMLEAGINVCLGTDSIVNLPSGVDGDNGTGLSVLEEARLLSRRDGVDAGVLLSMLTVNGCRALGWDAGACSLGVGARPMGVVAVDVSGTDPGTGAMERVLRSGTGPEFVVWAGCG